MNHCASDQGDLLALVVVVEDDDDLRRLLVRRLTRAGHVVESASDGAEGLTVIKAVKPDAAIIDWMMPRMAGVEVVQRMRNDEGLAHVKVLMLTARSQESDRLRALSAGANDYLVKPFAAVELLESLATILAESPALSSKQS